MTHHQAFNHESLDVYRLAVEVNRWWTRPRPHRPACTSSSAAGLRALRFGCSRFPRGRAALLDQGQRAVDALVCNVAEGLSKRSGAGKNALLIALDEAAECCAVLDCVDLDGAALQQAKLQRVGAMLAKMSR